MENKNDNPTSHPKPKDDAQLEIETVIPSAEKEELMEDNDNSSGESKTVTNEKTEEDS